MPSTDTASDPSSLPADSGTQEARITISANAAWGSGEAPKRVCGPFVISYDKPRHHHIWLDGEQVACRSTMVEAVAYCEADAL